MLYTVVVDLGSLSLCCPRLTFLISEAIPEPIRAIIQYEFEFGWSNDTIVADPFNVSSRTLQKKRHSWNGFGTVFIPCEHGCGRSNFWAGGTDTCKKNLASTGARCHGAGTVRAA